MNAPPRPPDAAAAVDVLRRAAELNREDSFRDGSIVRLPGYGQAVMTGDLHGNQKNFDKLVKYAMLDRVPARHVILHEMIHMETVGAGIDHSHELLLRAARYKCDFPDQVHFLQSNHELSQLTDYPIAKNGRAVLEDFNNSVEYIYGSDQVEDVLAAMKTFIGSFPIAVRTENRVFMAHSLPNVHDMDQFDPEVFDRDVRPADLADTGSVFHLVWGRRHTQEHIDALARRLDVDLFITGHQPQDEGFDVRFDRLIILASDHNHGVFLPFDLARRQTVDSMVANIRKFVAVE